MHDNGALDLTDGLRSLLPVYDEGDDASLLYDAFGRARRVRLVFETRESLALEVSSAGMDAEWGTEDDVVVRCALPARRFVPPSERVDALLRDESGGDS